MANPYHHPELKPHHIDNLDLRSLCFSAYNLLWASTNSVSKSSRKGGEWGPFDDPLADLHFELAELELSRMLLRLAMLIRTFDDIKRHQSSTDSAEYVDFCRSVDSKIVMYGEVFEGDQNAIETLRGCCNKLIHAEDFRPVYYTDDDREDAEANWGMSGQIELKGRLAGRNWSLALDAYNFLEAALETSKFSSD